MPSPAGPKGKTLFPNSVVTGSKRSVGIFAKDKSLSVFLEDGIFLCFVVVEFAIGMEVNYVTGRLTTAVRYENCILL